MTDYKELVERLRNSGPIPSIFAVRDAADAIESLRAKRDAYAESYDLLAKQGQEMMTERDALRAEVEALRADAERYRWIKSRAAGEVSLMRFANENSGFAKYGFATPEAVMLAKSADDAIDAARRQG